MRNEAHRHLQVTDSFGQCDFAQRALSGRDPVMYCALSRACLCEVMGEQLRLIVHDVCKRLLQHLRDLDMQLLAIGFEQRVVGGILHQRMLEGVGGFGVRASSKCQP